MILFMWIAPFFFLLGTSYYFNKNKKEKQVKNIYIVSALDALVSYAFIMMFFTIFFSMSIVNFFLLLILLFISALGFFTYNSEDEFSLNIQLDRQIETIKNNLIFFISSVLVFTLFYLVFRNQESWTRILVSLALSGGFIVLQFPAKRVLSNIYDKISTEISFLTDPKIIAITLGVSAITISALLLGFIRFTQTDFGYMDENQTRYEFSVDGEVIDFYKDQYLYVYNNNVEELHIRTEHHNEPTTYEIIPVSFNSSSPTDNSYNEHHFHLFKEYQVLFTPSYGAYLDGVLIPFTTGKKVIFINDDYCSECLLLETADKVYEVYNSDFNYIETIDLSLSNKTLKVIDDTFFLEDNDYYYLYADQTLKFSKYGETVAYSQTEHSFYTLTVLNGIVTYTIEKSDHTLYTGELVIEEGNSVKSLTTSILYNPIEIYRRYYLSEIDDALVVHSLKTSDYWISFVEYDPAQYTLNVLNSQPSHIEYIKAHINNGFNLPIWYKITGFISEDTPVASLPFLEGMITLIILVGLAIPYSNYSSYITVISYDAQFKK